MSINRIKADIKNLASSQMIAIRVSTLTEILESHDDLLKLAVIVEQDSTEMDFRRDHARDLIANAEKLK